MTMITIMTIQDMSSTETMKGKDGTTDGMMNTPDIGDFTINAIVLVSVLPAMDSMLALGQLKLNGVI